MIVPYSNIIALVKKLSIYVSLSLTFLKRVFTVLFSQPFYLIDGKIIFIFVGLVQDDILLYIEKSYNVNNL